MFKFKKNKLLDFSQLEHKAEYILNKVSLVKKIRRRQRLVKLVKYFFIIILIVFLLVVIFFGINYWTIKQIYSQATAGKDNLEQAIFLIKEQNFSQAKILAENSSDNFVAAINQSEEFKNKPLTKFIPYITGQINQAEYLLSAAEFLSRAVSQSASFGQDLTSLLEGNKKLAYSQLSLAEKQCLLSRIYQSTPELNGLKANISLALINIDQVEFNGLLFPLKGKVTNLKSQLSFVENLLAKAIPLSEILPALAGYPETAKYLIILQNNDELRPTGGFIGTYGILEINSGDITEFATHDIYHLDMPIKDKLAITPPQPLQKYLNVNRWYMRDANWSPDWPTAAKKIAWFYQTETRLAGQADNKKFTGVIALTPQFIIDLLAITGPINLTGVEYNKDNFQDLLQYKVEKGYLQLGVPSWQRKEVIGDIAKELKIKLFDLPPNRWPEIISTLDSNLTKKNILLYLSNPVEHNLIRQHGWSGEINNSAGDYLMIVDANLAALKTDAVISRSINYKVEQSLNGLFAKLRINYSHQGTFNWKTTRYRSYTRIYVPLGSQLIKAEGFVDNDIAAATELGKTSFAGFFSLEPGKIGSLYLEYKLPDKINELFNASQYSLYIQKQPGSNVNQLDLDLNFLYRVKSYNPASLSMQKVSPFRVKWEGDLNLDRNFEVRF